MLPTSSHSLHVTSTVTQLIPESVALVMKGLQILLWLFLLLNMKSPSEELESSTGLASHQRSLHFHQDLL